MQRERQEVMESTTSTQLAPILSWLYLSKLRRVKAEGLLLQRLLEKLEKQ